MSLVNHTENEKQWRTHFELDTIPCLTRRPTLGIITVSTILRANVVIEGDAQRADVKAPVYRKNVEKSKKIVNRV